MSNASDTSSDHASEITRADNAIKALEHALSGLRFARDAFEDASEGPHAIEIARAIDTLEIQIARTQDLIRRETFRRDAAELAAIAERST